MDSMLETGLTIASIIGLFTGYYFQRLLIFGIALVLITVLVYLKTKR